MTALSVNAQKNIVTKSKENTEKKSFFSSLKEAFVLAAPGIEAAIGADNYHYLER
ncbi:MAG: hypothetical protein ACI4EG_06585 [Fusicatenibacter sp.]|nr:hypothetical protein [Fusicatenibacter sp.]